VFAAALAALGAAATGCASVTWGDGTTWDSLFQIGTGAQGGATSILRLDGAVYRLPQVPAEDPMEFGETPGPHDPFRWFLRADAIPADAVLVIESIDVASAAPGDTNGHGEIRVALPGGDAFHVIDEGGPYRLWLAGRAIVHPSQAPDVFVEAANSSCAEVRMRGRLLTQEAAAKIAPAPFEEAIAPGGVERVGGKLGLLKKWRLEKPRALLQVRAGAVGGKPVRITLLGRGSNTLKHVLPNPLPTDRVMRMQDEALGHCGGGRVPLGKVWVITRIEYEGTADGDSNGPGEFLVQVGGEVIVHADRNNPRAKGVWEGRLEVRPGEESGVFVQIRNSSTGSATFTGTFE
jgi:hypothetical protein